MVCGFDDPDGDDFEEMILRTSCGSDDLVEPWAEMSPSSPPKSSSPPGCSWYPDQMPSLCEEVRSPCLPVECTPNAVKRRRLSKKTKCGDSGITESSSPGVPQVDPQREASLLKQQEASLLEQVEAEENVGGDGSDKPGGVVVFPLKQQWISWTSRKQYLWVFERVRGYWATLPSVKQKYGCSCSYREIRKVFATLSKAEKTQVAMGFVKVLKAPDYVQSAITSMFSEADKNSKLYGKTLLLTYNGPWGLLTADGSEFLDTGCLTLDEVVDRLRQDSATLKVWEEMKNFADDIMQSLQCSDVSCCLEVCTTTLEKETKARCHVHIWLRSCKRICVKDDIVLVFQGQSPNTSAVMGGIVRDTRAASFQGMLYTSRLKLGSVFVHATREPFTGYLVQPSWLMNLLQGQKISFDVCKESVLLSCQNVGRYLKDLEHVEQHFRQKEIEQEIVRVQRVLAGRRRPFCSLEQVQVWQNQYSDDNFRFRFLVLEGPSRFGKTQFARSIVPEENILELSCSGGVPIDLKSFQRHKHKLILFDEIEAPQVLALRKAFQAGPSPVQMGQSQTGMYTYSVFLYRVMFVLCSNTWTESLSKLKQGDAAWIEANQIHVEVDRQLFT
jgi:hypothetical protein